jgi:hypothetical protein
MASAQAALERVGRAVLFGQEARINWAFQKEARDEPAPHYHVFVGDLPPGVLGGLVPADWICLAAKGWAGTGDSRNAACGANRAPACNLTLAFTRHRT